MIYLDNNASTYMDPAVKEFISTMLDRPLNPSSIHFHGRSAKSIMEEARKQLANMLGICSREYQVIFTSSGTEANNLIMSNFKNEEIFVSAIEHLSILDQQKYSPNVNIIRVDNNGVVDISHLEELLEGATTKKKLVSVMLANNETGVIQPIKEVVRVARKYNALVHSDSAQAIGKIPTNIKEIGLDFASISGHKFGAALGAGALITDIRYPVAPMILGGGQEKGARSGTENVIAIGAFGVAAEMVKKDLEMRRAKMLELRSYLEEKITQGFPDIKIIAKNTDRLPNTTLMVIPDTEAQLMLIAFDLEGISVSSGAACSSGKVASSHVLKAMGVDEKESKSAIRVSVSYDQPKEDIEKFLEILEKIRPKL